MTGILIVAEAGSAGLRPVSLELVTAARSIASSFGGTVTALLMGSNLSGAAADLARAGVDGVIVAEDPRLAQLTAEAATTVVTAAIGAQAPSVVLLPYTTIGTEYAPRVAARLRVGLAADCVGISASNGSVVVSRPVLGGRMQADVTLDQGKVQVVTVRSGAFAKAELGAAAAPITTVPVELSAADTAVVVRGIAAKESSGVGLDAAKVVVGGGRGLKEGANFKLIEELAASLGGAVAATRAVTDVGWRHHNEQLGQTGRVISPDLYIAVGISGAVQHMVGVQGSQYIVAINRDPDAPIFKSAAFGIVGDLFEVVPALTAQVAAARG